MALHVIAAEAGGTTTRGVLLELDHGHIRRLATASSGSGNPNVVGPETARRAWSQVLTELQAAAPDPTAVFGALSCAGTTSAAASAWDVAFSTSPVLMHDTEAPVWAVSATGSATVLVAGTGSMAAVFENGRTLRTAGGRGWWLGDEGSGTWIGRELLRLVLDDIDAGLDTPLRAEIAAELGFSSSGLSRSVTSSDVFNAVYCSDASVANTTGRFAPLVETSLDPRAEQVRQAAAGHLLDLLSVIDPAGPIALTGSVTAGSIGEIIRARITAPVRIEPDGLTGTAMRALMAEDMRWTTALRDRVAALLDSARPALPPIGGLRGTAALVSAPIRHP